MITAKYGVGKNIVNTMLKMGGLGGVYSAGKADPSEPIVEEGVTQDISFGDAVKERGKEGVFGAGVSAVIGGVFKGAFSARELAKHRLHTTKYEDLCM